MTSRPSTAAPTLAVLAVVSVTLLLALYVGGYVSQGRHRVYEVPPDLLSETRGHPYVATRFYGSEWKASFYYPGAVVESWLTGMPVTTKSTTY